jgi:hypothetical protein
LAGLAADHPGRPEFRREVAGGAFNLMNHNLRAGRLAEARASLERIGQLPANHRDDVEIRLRLARGAVNLIKGVRGGGADRGGRGDRARLPGGAVRAGVP